MTGNGRLVKLPVRNAIDICASPSLTYVISVKRLKSVTLAHSSCNLKLSPVAAGAVEIWRSSAGFWPDFQARREAWETRLCLWSFPCFARQIISTTRSLRFFLQPELDRPPSCGSRGAGLATACAWGTTLAAAALGRTWRPRCRCLAPESEDPLSPVTRYPPLGSSWSKPAITSATRRKRMEEREPSNARNIRRALA